MLSLGHKVKFHNSDAIILVCFGDEVLLFIDEHTIKWVDKALLEAVPSD
ncbi:MAG: hypothetical protein N3I35_06145 [Clostridia bacterium]|nr:hypothetical protein [Clostridia bacterium]